MRLDEEVNQARFRNNQHRAVANILYTYSNVASRLQRMLACYDLTLQQFNILRILQRQHPEPACNCKIREQMLDSRSDITRIVDRLIKEQFVTRKTCNDDRRKVSIAITPKGLKALENMDELNKKMDAIVTSLTNRELEELNRLLDKVRDSE